MKLRDFDVLTFDCYGTLIDWETGIFQAVEPWLSAQGISADRERVLAAFGRWETVQQQEAPDMLYPDVLAHVLPRMAEDLGARASEADGLAFGASVRDWPAFPDSSAALAYLKEHYKLVILSNIDRGSFAHSNARLGVEFDAIYTAQDIGSYKPDPRNFDYMLEKLGETGIAKSQILHTAESLYHDHVPAQRAGLASAWIHRRQGKEGAGATAAPDGDARYDFYFGSMAEMADAHRAEPGD